MDLTPEGIEATAAALGEAMKPLIEFRRDYEVDVEDLDEETAHPLVWAVAEAVEQAFVALDSATRALEMPEDYVPEPLFVVEVMAFGNDDTGGAVNDGWMVRNAESNDIVFVTMDKDEAERVAAAGGKQPAPEATADTAAPARRTASDLRAALDDDELVLAPKKGPGR